ncbi:Por secretion system C-terminal sorting domain-containing protein [Algoriphagus faecimaris]|uniref:Por secretion system C-terminal sorting domain-containing protein n=1 Tax=Algoriphagus faecimaris TaxID=686796 RepID=A0A1G6R6C5_9BACT|nr:T9SS type A sorting domain-containing protein [Algoriphagus faecimaris]SDC99635.1 Por secretion system C-terminal sorting domain-containing protein [Algoriphagus faecimaris]
MKNQIFLIFLFWLGFAGVGIAQNYATRSQGDWDNESVWNIENNCEEPSKGKGGEAANKIPQTDKFKTDCPVEVFIKHSVSKSGKNDFSQQFKSLTINSEGLLNFISDQKITLSGNSFGGVIFTVDGGTLEAFDLEISTGAQLKVINGGKVILRNNLSTAGNGGVIELDASSSIQVKNEFKLSGSNSNVKLSGAFSTKTLSNTGSNSNSLQIFEGALGEVESFQLSGSTSTLLKGNLLVEKDFDFSGSASLNIGEQGFLKVNGTSTIRSSTPIISNGNINFEGSVTLSGNAQLQSNGNLLVGGKSTLEGSASIKILGFATFESDLTLKGGGADLQVSGEADVLVKGDLNKPENSGSISVLDRSSLIICNDRTDGNKEGAFPPLSFARMNIGPSPAYYGGCRILPIEFAEFKVELVSSNRSGQISWSTAKEWNSSYFEIERSINDVKSWESIGTVDAAGFSDQLTGYYFVDKSLPAAGGNVFYRIKQVDFDNKETYSQTKALKVSSLQGVTAWKTYPNPTNGANLTIELISQEAYQDVPVLVRLIAMSGQHTVIRVDKVELMGNYVQEWLQTQRPGIYTMEISWGIQKEYQKIQLAR